MDQTVAAVRSFNRFYTRLVGALDDRFLGSSLALPEARVLFEIAQAQTALASDLQRQLGLDAGYVSRLLRRLEARGLIRRERGGSIEIRFSDESELLRIVDLLLSDAP